MRAAGGPGGRPDPDQKAVDHRRRLRQGVPQTTRSFVADSLGQQLGVLLKDRPKVLQIIGRPLVVQQPMRAAIVGDRPEDRLWRLAEQGRGPPALPPGLEAPGGGRVARFQTFERAFDRAGRPQACGMAGARSSRNGPAVGGELRLALGEVDDLRPSEGGVYSASEKRPAALRLRR